MKVLHCVKHSLVRYTPGRIAAYWGRYTEHQGQAVALRRGSPNNIGNHFTDTLNPYGYYCVSGASKAVLRRMVNEADVIHCHDDAYPYLIERRFGMSIDGKVLVYHAHIGDLPMRLFHKNRKYTWDDRVKHVTITNGYGHLFDEDEVRSKGKHKWGRLPDILDLHHPAYRPEPELRKPINKGRVQVVYTYSNNREGNKLNAKRPVGHRKLMTSPTHIPGVKFTMVTNRPFEEAMAIKKKAHIVLEEVFTPYLHLSALEGAAVGAMVLTRSGAYVRKELSKYLGAPEKEWPFYQCTERNLREVLTMLAKNRDMVVEWGQKARNWMLKYYQPAALLKLYEEFYGRNE